MFKWWPTNNTKKREWDPFFVFVANRYNLYNIWEGTHGRTLLERQDYVRTHTHTLHYCRCVHYWRAKFNYSIIITIKYAHIASLIGRRFRFSGRQYCTRWKWRRGPKLVMEDVEKYWLLGGHLRKRLHQRQFHFYICFSPLSPSLSFSLPSPSLYFILIWWRRRLLMNGTRLNY